MNAKWSRHRSGPKTLKALVAYRSFQDDVGDNGEQDEDRDRAKHVYQMPFGPALFGAIVHIAANRRLGMHFDLLQQG